MGAQIVHDLRGCVTDTLQTLIIQQSSLRVRMRELQAPDQHLLVVGNEGPLLQELLCLLGSFHRIACQHSLIDQFRRRQCRLITKHDVEEFQPIDMAAENNETDRQRSGQHQSDRSPEPSPERGRGNDIDR
jgi:hypothetical protein